MSSKGSANDPQPPPASGRSAEAVVEQTIPQAGELVVASTPLKSATAELFGGSSVAVLRAGLAHTTHWIVLLYLRTKHDRRMRL
jgi:hypothetical protein